MGAGCGHKVPVEVSCLYLLLFPGCFLVPAVPPSVMEPLWVQFAALLPERVDSHPLGCHRSRIPDRIVSGQAHPGPGAGGGL